MPFFNLHAQVVLPRKDGLPLDAAINTFSFLVDFAAPEDGIPVLQPQVEAFYNDASGDGDPICSHINRTRDRGTDACTVRWYNVTGHLNGSAAGPPIGVIPWTLGSNSGTDALPEEVALVLSFHGDDDTVPEFGPGTRPRARHRGRVYIGPLLYHVSAGGIGDPIVPDASMVQSLVDAGSALIDFAPGSWSVWSRRNAAFYAVVGGWVDNAFDTVRKRGFTSTSRTTFPPVI